MLIIKISMFIILSIITHQTNHAMNEVEEIEEELTKSFNKMNLKIESKKYNDKASLYLFNMIQSGKNLHLINQLLNKKADPNIQDFWGWTPLHYACKKGLLNPVIALLTHKDNPAYPNIKNKEGKTSLFYACQKNFIDTVKALLEHKADPNIQEIFGGFTKSTIPVVQSDEETFHTLTFNLPI